MLRLLDEFCGLGGSTAGAARVPGVQPFFAANHNRQAIESHAANHPQAQHWQGDVQKVNVGTAFPYAELFWSSPACPAWTDARGVKRTFDRTNQLALWAEEPTEEELKAMRSRALMEEVVLYLRAMSDRGRPVLAGVVENVIQCRKWDQWDRWLGEIRALGYTPRVIALNSMHAAAPASAPCPQSRDRLYVAYWHRSLGRVPDWDKWLRPAAWCPACEQVVQAVQVFKKPGADMGRYRHQYVYRCPRTTCRNAVVEPEVRPAADAIDWTLPGTPIGEGGRLKPATLARIRAGIAAYWAPLLTPAGGTWRDRAVPVDMPMPARSTRENDGIAVPPLMVPVEARPGKQAAPGDEPLRTQTCRRETGLALAPFVTPLRGGGDRERAYAVDRPLHTFTAGGFHHGLAAPPRRGAEALLVPYYGTGRARPADRPVGALPTRERYALAAPGGDGVVDISEVRFRMLEPHEIQAAMAFDPSYLVLPTAKRDKVRLLGNAVTPNTAEVLISALVEAVTGQELERHPRREEAVAA